MQSADLYILVLFHRLFRPSCQQCQQLSHFHMMYGQKVTWTKGRHSVFSLDKY